MLHVGSMTVAQGAPLLGLPKVLVAESPFFSKEHISASLREQKDQKQLPKLSITTTAATIPTLV